MHVWPKALFPSPLQVWDTLFIGFSDKTFTLAILASLKRILIGYLLSMLIGIPLGILIGRVKLADETIGSLIMGLQTMPSICWLPLSLLWFGLNEKAIIFIIILGAIFSISLATADGVKNVPPLYVRAAQTMGAKGLNVYYNVVLPAALPSIITGMKLAWSFAWRALMAGELLSSGLGLGQVLMMGRDLLDMSQVIAVMVIIMVLGLAIDRLVFFRLQQGVGRKWGLEQS